MNKLIGIAGKAGSGKDTAAQVIDNNYAYYNGDFTITRFASGIYEVIDQWLEIPKSYYNRDLKELLMPLFLTGARAPKNFTKLLPIIYNFVDRGDAKFDVKLSRCVTEVYNFFWNKVTFYPNYNFVSERRNDDKFILVSPRELLQLMNKFTELVDDSFWINIAASKLKEDENVIFADVRTEAEAEYIKRNGGILVYIEREGINIPLSNHVSESYQSYLQKNADTIIINNGSLEDFKESVNDNETIENYLCGCEESKQMSFEF